MVVEHRRRLRKPLTAGAASKLAEKFRQCEDPNLAADTMLARGWQGIEPKWMHDPANRPGGRPPTAAEKHVEGLGALAEAFAIQQGRGPYAERSDGAFDTAFANGGGRREGSPHPPDLELAAVRVAGGRR